MQEFHNFYIHTPSFNQRENTVVFHYSFDMTESFEETFTLSKELPFRKDIDSKIVENILFHISIAFGMSYYKLFPTKKIIVDGGFLNEEQKKYWNIFYTQGLGEYFFTNNIDFGELCYFESTSEKSFEKQDFSLSEKTLLPIGGGKDSIVSSLLLKEQEVTPFIFGKIDPIKQGFLDIYGKKELLIQRQLDPKLFQMNEEGYYNGHVPITGLISFFMTFVCYLYDYQSIIFSNEKSADVGNTVFHENEINHQYSKSRHFRENFSEYVGKYISSNIKYSSLLEEMYEIQIAKKFAQQGKQYFDIFSSCNRNFKILTPSDTGEDSSILITTKWCCNCPKCLFVYMILRPFLTVHETHQIFGEELYMKEDLEVLFLETIGISGIKPFECVGEVDEAKLAAYMSLDKFKDTPYLLEVFQKHLTNADTTEYFQKLQTKYNV